MSVEISYLGRGIVKKVFGKNGADKSECKTLGFCEVLLSSGQMVSVMPDDTKTMADNQVRDFRVNIKGIPISI